MTILTTAINQNFRAIPNKIVSGILTVVFRNETTKDIFTRTVNTYFYGSDILTFNVDLDFLIDKTFYTYSLILNTEIIYKDKVYCTNGGTDIYIMPTIDNNNYIVL